MCKHTKWPHMFLLVNKWGPANNSFVCGAVKEGILARGGRWTKHRTYTAAKLGHIHHPADCRKQNGDVLNAESQCFTRNASKILAKCVNKIIKWIYRGRNRNKNNKTDYEQMYLCSKRTARTLKHQKCNYYLLKKLGIILLINKCKQNLQNKVNASH